MPGVMHGFTPSCMTPHTRDLPLFRGTLSVLFSCGRVSRNPPGGTLGRQRPPKTQPPLMTCRRWGNPRETQPHVCHCNLTLRTDGPVGVLLIHQRWHCAVARLGSFRFVPFRSDANQKTTDLDRLQSRKSNGSPCFGLSSSKSRHMADWLVGHNKALQVLQGRNWCPGKRNTC